MMKFYIATRFSNEPYRLLAIEMKEKLKALGHEMTFDWMNGASIKPYENDPALTAKTAGLALDGARNADFFILIADQNGTGMYVEFGAAIAEFENRGAPKLFVMGAEKYCSMFNFYPAVTMVDSLEEVVQHLK